MEPFDGNVLNYHHFMALFKEVVENKVEDPRGRMIRLLKYTSGEARELINHYIQLPSNEGFKYAKYLLEEAYGEFHCDRHIVQRGKHQILGDSLI